MIVIEEKAIAHSFRFDTKHATYGTLSSFQVFF